MPGNVKRYALWNNKGGVGKTFLTFAFATEYARKNPDSLVVVIDMCPQANISEVLLGGNGKGTENLSKLIKKEQTIGAYFKLRISSPHGKVGSEYSVVVSPHEFNDNLPLNLRLIAGDPSLELQVQTINNIAVQELPEGAWRNVHSWVIDIEDAIRIKHEDKDILFLLDCNPSFSAYTEQAILAAERLIIPCSPDGSSARAIRNVFQLVYGYDAPIEYEKASFAGKSKQYKMTLPSLYLTILNRSTIYGKREPSMAYQSMLGQIKEEVLQLYRSQSNRNHFVVHNDGKIEDNLFSYIPDIHSTAVVCSALGMPIHKIAESSRGVSSYTLSDGTKTQLNTSQVKKYRKELEKIVEHL